MDLPGLRVSCIASRNDARRRFRADGGRNLTLGLVLKEAVDLGGRAVVRADGETVIGSIEDQVLAHDGQTDEAEISTRQRTRRCADIDAGQAGATVSCKILPSIAG